MTTKNKISASDKMRTLIAKLLSDNKAGGPLNGYVALHVLG